MITRRDLSELMSFHPEPYLTSSLYLEIDGSPQENYPIVLKDLIKQAKQDLEKQQLTAELRKSIEDDFKRFSDFVSLQFNRHGVRSLIIFSCSARKWWRVFTLALPIRSRLISNSRLSVRPLIFLLNQYNRYLIILIERAKARIFEYHAGEMTEHASIQDDAPKKVKEGGYAGYNERHIERHIEDHIRRHFKNVADVALDLFKKHEIDELVLLGTEQNTREMKDLLRSPLNERIAATEHEEMEAGFNAIREKIMKIEKERKAIQDQQILQKLFAEVRSGGLGVLGLESTIRALQQGQVNVLFVQQGYARIGYRCRECKSLLTENGACDYCGGITDTVHDIVEELVDEASLQGCQIKYITMAGSSLASEGGGIGALLRYKP